MTLATDVAELEVVVRDIDNRVARLEAQLEQHAQQSRERHEQLTRAIESANATHSRLMLAMIGVVILAIMANAALVGVSMHLDSGGGVQVEGAP